MVKQTLLKQEKTREPEPLSEITDPVARDILSILWEKAEEKIKAVWISVSEWVEKALRDKENIIRLLSRYTWEIYLKLSPKQKKDKDICLAALRNSPEAYFHLPKEYKFNLEFWKELILSLIREGKNLVDINNYLDTYFKSKDKVYTKLQEFLELALKDSESIYLDDLAKWMLLAKSKFRDLYDLLTKNKIVVWKWKKLSLWDDFQKKFSKAVLTSDRLAWKNKEEIEAIKREIFASIVWLDISKLSEDAIFLIDTIISLCVVRDSKENIENNKKEDAEKTENEELTALDLEEDDEIEPEVKLDFCLPNCDYFISSWNTYTISVEWQRPVNLTKDELSTFTTKWLNNFIKFYWLLCDLDLNFLWDRHKSDFVNILNNVVWFNYPDWNWVSESRAIRVLNLIARAIWIVWKVWDSEVKDFNSLESVSLVFRQIRETGVINGKSYYTGSGIFRKPAVEMALKDLSYISVDWELSFSKFLYWLEEETKSKDNKVSSSVTQYHEKLDDISFAIGEQIASNDSDYDNPSSADNVIPFPKKRNSKPEKITNSSWEIFKKAT